MCSHCYMLIERCAQGFYPNCFKTGKILPVYKGGDKSKFENYRPIRLAIALSKWLDKCAKCNYRNTFITIISCFLITKGFTKWKKYKWWFIQDDETYTWQHRQRKKTLIAVIYLTKIFYTIDRGIFLKKLNKLGVPVSGRHIPSVFRLQLGRGIRVSQARAPPTA